MPSQLSLSVAFLLFVAISGCGNQATSTVQRTQRPSPSQVIDLTPSAATPTTAGPRRGCNLTLDDGLSPSYRSSTPVRSAVGQGHVLTGTVRSSRDCTPIANAQLELLPEYPGQGHLDEARATVFTDSAGQYRFECDPPDHIHMRISAPGYITTAQNSYHPEGQAKGSFDVVLAPETP